MSEKKQEEYKIANNNKILQNLIRLKNLQEPEERDRISSKLGRKIKFYCKISAKELKFLKQV